jgi:carboxyl-terminal processing protease
MKQKINQIITVLLLIVLAGFASSCRKEKVTAPTLSDDQQVMAFTDTLMHEVYLWYDKVPQVDYSNFSSPEAYLDSLRYKQLDRWSFMITATEASQYFDQGISDSYGFLPIIDQNNKVWVAFVYENSPMYRAGIRRSFQLTKVGGVAVGTLITRSKLSEALSQSSNRFAFIDNNGKTVDIMVSTESFSMKTVLYHDTIQVGSKKVGYMVLNSFLSPTVNEFNEAFKDFTKAQVTEFVLDLRYNGGGLVSVSQYLSEYFAPASADGKVFGTFHFNDKYKSLDSSFYLNRNSTALNINRLFVITTSNTASASELLINCLRPYMTVKLIGSKTHGKPVGSEGFQKNNWVIFPIVMRIVNALEQGDFYGGLAVDYQATDNVTQPWGSANEDCLKAALYYIGNEAFPSTKSVLEAPQTFPLDMKGFRQQIGCY